MAPTKEELKNLTLNELANKYPDKFYKKLSAGTFEDRSFLDRINPFTPFSSKKFVPNEKGRALLNKYKEQYGKPLVVLPLSATMGKEKAEFNQKSGLQGLFKSQAFIGGTNDPFRKYVYLNPNEVREKNEVGLVKGKPGLFTLAHEAYHAYDPSLTTNPYTGKKTPTGFQRMAGGLADFLTAGKTDFDRRSRSPMPDNFDELSVAEQFTDASKGAMNRFQREIDAQSGALADYRDLGYKGYFSEQADLEAYPASYIRDFIKGFNTAKYEQAQGSEGKYNPAVRQLQKDTNFIDAKENLIERAKAYSKSKGLGRFRQN